MRTFLTLLALGAVLQQPPRPSAIQDGEAHGDPPFVLEEGWEPLLNGKDLAGWKACDASTKSEWYTTRFVMFERLLGPTRLDGRAAPSGVMLNGPTGRTANLCSERAFGRRRAVSRVHARQGLELRRLSAGAYEIQIFDSWGSIEGVKTSDAGAIYHRWINEQGVGGSPPLVNASRRPGEWQSFQAWFRAPRFDAAGKKTQPARFVRVLFNGQLVQKDVDIDGPTRASLEIPEAAQNPLMIQGDHGPVAFRNIYVRPLRPLVLR